MVSVSKPNQENEPITFRQEWQENGFWGKASLILCMLIFVIIMLGLTYLVYRSMLADTSGNGS